MSKTTRHRATVIWDGAKSDLRAHTIQLAGQTLAASATPAFGGDSQKADPEELFVASLSACHMLWFLDFARRERLRVLSYVFTPRRCGCVDGGGLLLCQRSVRDEPALLQGADAGQSLVVAVVVNERHAGLLGCRADQEVDRRDPAMVPVAGQQRL